VLRQTYTDFRLVVVDDGSTDKTLSIAQRFADEDARVTVLRQANSGVASARNAGAFLAPSDAIAFLDADDRWECTKLERQVTVLAANPTAAVVGCLMRYESAAGARLGTAGAKLHESDMERIRAGRFVPFPLSAAVYRAEHFIAIGGFDERLDKVVPGQVEDLDLLARAATYGSVICIPQVLGSYTLHGASASAANFLSQRMGARFVRERLAAERIGLSLSWETFSRSYRLTLRQRRGDRSQYHYRRAGVALAEQRRRSALVHFLAAASISPRYAVARAIRQSGRWPVALS
jgi:glycosyltransferase involved in cell wall biosynthesis